MPPPTSIDALPSRGARIASASRVEVVGHLLAHEQVEQLGLVAQLPRGLDDRRLGRRRDLLEARQDLVAHAHAREAAVAVGGVLAPLEPGRAAVLSSLLTSDLEEWPHEPPAPWLHPE